MTSIKSLFLFCFVIMVSKSLAQSIALYEQHNGKFDYTAIGNTLNLIENGAFSECSILQGSEAELNMPASQSVIAAYLYWAGSGAGDFDGGAFETRPPNRFIGLCANLAASPLNRRRLLRR